MHFPIAHVSAFLANFRNLVRPSQTSLIMAQMRNDNALALKATIGPRAAAAAEEKRIRSLLTAEENRARTAKQTASAWLAHEKEGKRLARLATAKHKLQWLDGPTLNSNRATSQRPSILTNAECLPVLAEFVAVAEEMTEQELRWIPAARDLIGAEPKDLLSWPCVKRAKGAARGKSTGRPRKVSPGSEADMVRIAFTSAPLMAGPREVGVDSRVGNLPVRREDCTCGGYRFNASIPCTGHGFGRRASVTHLHPNAQPQAADRRY